MYGSTPVAMDKSLGINFDAGDKSFRCIGFTDRNNIHDQHFTGSGVWMAVPQKEAPVSEKLFVALVTAMKSSNSIMLARYVYRNGSKPKIMALVPHPDTEKNECKRNASLMMMEMHFAGELVPSAPRCDRLIKQISFPDDQVKMDFPALSTSKDIPSQEQYDAVEQMIDSMDLMTALDNDGEAFVHKKLLNPTIQYTFRALAHRYIDSVDVIERTAAR